MPNFEFWKWKFHWDFEPKGTSLGSWVFLSYNYELLGDKFRVMSDEWWDITHSPSNKALATCLHRCECSHSLIEGDESPVEMEHVCSFRPLKPDFLT